VHVRFVGLIGVLLCGGLTSSCGCEEDRRQRASAAIGPEGGSVSSADGQVTVSVPAGALGSATTLTIEESKVPPPDGALGPAYEISPSAGGFGEPVTLEFRYDDADLAGRPPEAIRVGALVDDVWICIPYSAAHPEASVVVTAVSHFSTYAIHFNDCARHAECTGPEACLASEVCGIPCISAADCPSPLACLDSGLCGAVACEDDAGCGAGTVCAHHVVRSLCLPSCDADPCGDPAEQMRCTRGGKCVFEQECPDVPEEIDCDPLGRTCLHQWCVDPDLGCDCADPDCRCIPAGGDADTDSDTDTGTDTETDTDTASETEIARCEQDCVAADDCCGFAGCSRSQNAQWACLGRHCRFLGCADDGECGFYGAGARCYQRIGYLYGQCANPCPCADYMDCLDAYGGETFCGFDYAGCAGDADCKGLDCVKGDCVCTDDPQCEAAHGAGYGCVQQTCEDVIEGLGARGEACAADTDCDSNDCCLSAPNDCALEWLCRCE